MRSSRIIATLTVFSVISLGTLPLLANAATISGCVNSSSGVLRVAAKCSTKEKSVTWNSVGPQGAIGPQGSVGPQGPTGATGPSSAPVPTKQYKYELPTRDLPMSKANTYGVERDVILAVDTSKMPAGSYSIGAYLYGSFSTPSVTSNHEYVWCYFQLKSAYDAASFATNKSGVVLDGDAWYDQDYYQDFVLHLSDAEDLNANYGIIYLVCRHNVALTGVYGFVVAHQYDATADLPLAPTP